MADAAFSIVNVDRTLNRQYRIFHERRGDAIFAAMEMNGSR